jgi:hypothetical protein
MPRTRDVIVPNAVQGIEEVVITHTKTRRGTIRTTEKVVLILQAPTKQSKRPSRSKQRTKLQSQLDEAEGSGGVIPTTTEADGVQTHLFMDEHEYEPPDGAAEDSRPQATVRVGFSIYSEWHI